DTARLPPAISLAWARADRSARRPAPAPAPALTRRGTFPSRACRHHLGERVPKKPRWEATHPFATPLDRHAGRTGFCEREVTAPPRGERAKRASDAKLLREARILRAQRHLAPTQQQEAHPCATAYVGELDAHHGGRRRQGFASNAAAYVPQERVR